MSIIFQTFGIMDLHVFTIFQTIATIDLFLQKLILFKIVAHCTCMQCTCTCTCTMQYSTCALHVIRLCSRYMYMLSVWVSLDVYYVAWPDNNGYQGRLACAVVYGVLFLACNGYQVILCSVIWGCLA